MDDVRQVKRARQACEPCRRKKSKCPGERPICSHCQRLGQRCVYNAPGGNVDFHQATHNREIDFRIGRLEGKMDRLIQQLSPDSTASRRTGPAFHAVSPSNSVIIEDTAGLGQAAELNESFIGEFPTTESQLLEMGRLYMTWCHNQPIGLFAEETFIGSLMNRDRELILALQSLSLRFPPGTLTPQRQERLDSIAKNSRRLVMDRITDGQVELSTLQSLCILSQYDFIAGKVRQAELNLTIANHLAHSIQPTRAPNYVQERNDCLKSITALQQLQGCIVPSTKLISAPPSLHGAVNLFGAWASCAAPEPTSLFDNPLDGQGEGNIASYATRLCETYQLARAYAARRVGRESLPPWDSRSDYSIVLQSHLQNDCQFPMKYRFTSNNFINQDHDSLQRQRHYWGPFLFLQIVYSTIPCILNHPFLLSMRLRNFRYTLPQSFVQQSFEHISRHTGWIIYFLDLLEKKSFQVSDPCLAHCAAVVATIHLQHSFIKDNQLREKSQAGFEICMRSELLTINYD